MERENSRVSVDTSKSGKQSRTYASLTRRREAVLRWSPLSRGTREMNGKGKRRGVSCRLSRVSSPALPDAGRDDEGNPRKRERKPKKVGGKREVVLSVFQILTKKKKKRNHDRKKGRAGEGRTLAPTSPHHSTFLWPGITIEIRWCPAHKGIAGNEKAEEWAKIAAEEPDTHGVEWLNYSDRTEVRPMPLPRFLANLKQEISEKNWWRHVGGWRQDLQD